MYTFLPHFLAVSCRYQQSGSGDVKTVELWRRFREFDTLRKYLVLNLPEVRLPDMLFDTCVLLAQINIMWYQFLFCLVGTLLNKHVSLSWTLQFTHLLPCQSCTKNNSNCMMAETECNSPGTFHQAAKNTKLLMFCMFFGCLLRGV